MRCSLTLRARVKSEPQIQLDGVMIFGADVEPGHEAFTAMVPRDMLDKVRSVTSAAMCGMHADTANLRVAVEGDTLAAHCD
jgi:hypothetical protein